MQETSPRPTKSGPRSATFQAAIVEPRVSRQYCTQQSSIIQQRQYGAQEVDAGDGHWRNIATALIDVELARTSKRYNAITSRDRRVYLQPKGATFVDEKELQESRRLGGKPGESAPTVDPQDVKTVWEIGRDAHADHPGGGLFIGAELMKRACKPGADIQAVSYRAMLLGLIIQLASEHLTPFIRDGQPDDAVFRAAAIVPAEWMGVGIQRQGPPFDVNEFLRLCKRTET